MSNLEKFIEEWFPKTEQWNNVAKFILESGVELTDTENTKWLTGYTNIGKSNKPHHKDEYKRYMEESMFMLHDVLHNIFTLNVDCSEEEYIHRQIYGELFTFYLTEYVLPKDLIYTEHSNYIDDVRDTYWLMFEILQLKPENINIIDYMFDIFIKDEVSSNLKHVLTCYSLDKNLAKYSKMFKEDLENSRKNYRFVPKGIQNYCMVGKSSQNHIDFFESVSKGAVKNMKREFNLKLPEQWI